MSPIFKLIANENMKIFRRSRTWVMLGLLVLATLLMAALQNHLVMRVGSQAAYQASQALINRYDAAHHINPNLQTGWSFAVTAANLSILLVALIVVVAGDTTASEFSRGTVKMLLTQTATRTKVLAAKYVSVLLFSFFAAAVLLVSSVLAGWVFFGAAGANSPHAYIDPHQAVQQMSTLSYLLLRYGVLLVQIVEIATVAFMLSAVFRSGALAITVSLLAYLFGGTIVASLSSFGWAKYILFANTDLTQFVVNGPVIHGLTLGFSITMLVVYLVIMNLIAWWSFVQRDVAFH